MKLGTDAVLLGCLADHPHPTHILDIGTGSGVIALQLAQRFENAQVLGLEIETDAAHQAQLNFKNSPWADRLSLTQADVTTWQSELSFDLICCNPPYYENGFPIADDQRRLVRSNELLSFEQLALSVARLLRADGSFWVILPTAGMQKLCGWMALSGLYLQEITFIYPKINKACNRQIAAFRALSPEAIEEHTVCIRSEDNSYTDTYKALTAAFYLQLK